MDRTGSGCGGDIFQFSPPPHCTWFIPSEEPARPGSLWISGGLCMSFTAHCIPCHLLSTWAPLLTDKHLHCCLWHFYLYTKTTHTIGSAATLPHHLPTNSARCLKTKLLPHCLPADCLFSYLPYGYTPRAFIEPLSSLQPVTYHCLPAHA